MPVVEERARDDPDGIREVDDPRPVRSELPDAPGDPEDERDRAQGLAQAARARRLLPDAAARERDGLVGEPCLLSTDPNLDQDEVRSVDGAVEIVCNEQPAVEPLPLEHPPGETSHHLAALRIDVLQHELADVDPLALARQPGHELGRVRRAAADDGDFQVPLPVMPPSFWVASTKPEAALVRSQGWRRPGKEEGGLWRRVIAGQKPACIAGRGTSPSHRSASRPPRRLAAPGRTG
jgi:hypothetical protein